MIRRATVRVGRGLPARLAAAIRAAADGPGGWAAELLVRERAVDLPTTGEAGLVRDLLALRLVARVRDRLEPRARVDLVRDLVVASDLRRHRHAPDFVVGPGPASFTLARHVR
ncbi:MAG TPA: hypothetical protein VFX65_05255, partial [Candidatus Limnocylindrales bacterium]|nr:hypothetical protein [Candidatus Limnocylindrales bacterium]